MMPRTRRGGPKGADAPFSGGGAATATLEGPAPEDGSGRQRKSRRRYDPAWDDWKRPRRWPGVLITCLVVLGFLAAVAWHYRPHPHLHRASIAPSAIHSLPPYVPGAVGTGASVSAFAGKSNASGLAFTATGNLLLLHAKCVCTYSFVLTVTDPGGNLVTLPVTSSGYFNGTLSMPLKAGHYALSVVASGPWSVQLVQPTAAMPAISTPFGYFSTGGSVIGPFSSANQYLSLKFLSFSNGSVAMHLLNLQGATVATPFSGRGIVDKSATIAGLPNPYYIEVDANGYWVLNVRRSAAS